MLHGTTLINVVGISMRVYWFVSGLCDVQEYIGRLKHSSRLKPGGLPIREPSRHPLLGLCFGVMALNDCPQCLDSEYRTALVNHAMAIGAKYG